LQPIVHRPSNNTEAKQKNRIFKPPLAQNT
jgi:hypothetical protein